MRIASLVLSSKEVPERWSIVIFLKGCNFRCRHCHNWRLVTFDEKEEVDLERVIFEVKNLLFVDTLVISGGEPLIYDVNEIGEFIESVKREKEDIKLRIDTNGYFPEKVRELKKLVNGFAIDIKAPPENKELYGYTVNTDVDTERIKESIFLADGMELTVFRTPKYPWLSDKDIESIKRFTEKLKSPWYLNDFFEIPDCPFNVN